MYLKSLEITGFKSFPDRIKIDFGKGITSIVGPNGSGKSNISDAIRWVLGEQSTKTLRGGKMEDVIFAGTPLRKGAGYAEVALSIDNSSHFLKSEYETVVISRRYYRSGESDYFINKKNVRLRDVNELLMDTGLGRDGYSIIGQGRIDEILSLKSDDRRDIFEEAAGISKFKYRREEAEKKLQQTSENLIRLEDIYREVESRRAPLADKAAKARKYLFLRDELRDIEIKLWAEELEETDKKSTKTESDYNIAGFALEEARIASERAYSSAEKAAERIRELNINEEQLRETAKSAESEIAAIQSSLSSTETAIGLNKDNIERIKSEKTEGESRAKEIKSTIEERSTKAEQTATVISEFDKRLSEIREELQRVYESSGKSEGKAAALEALSVEYKIKISANEAKIASAAGNEGELSVRHKLLLSDIGGFKESMLLQKAKTNERKERVSQARDKSKELTNELDGYRLKLEARDEKLGKLRSDIESEISGRDSILLRKNLLTDMQRDYEGFNSAVRMVMREKARGVLGGIHGTVAELLTVESRFTIAIETALGGALQNIVTDDDENAKSAIRLLKEKQGGRATFLPISAIKGYFLNEKGINDEAGVLGIACDLVSYDPKYDSIFKSLLARTVICEDLNAATRLARLRGYRFRIVTLDGQVVNQGGSMTGGSLSQTNGILRRAAELEQLTKRVADANKKIEELRARHDKLNRETDSLKYSVGMLSDDIAKLGREIFEETAKINSEEKLEETLNAQLVRAEREANDIITDISSNKSEGQRLESETEKLKALLEETEKSLRDYQRESGEYNEEAQKVIAAMNKLSEQKAASEAQYSEQLAAIDELRLILTRAENAVLLSGESVEGLERENEEKQNELSELRTRLEEAKNTSEKISAEIAKLISQRLESEEKRVNSDKKAREYNERIINLEKEISRLGLMRDNYENLRKTLSNKLWESYELTINEAVRLNSESPLENKSAADKRANELRASIKALGDVNIGAIDEYKELDMRYQLLTSQKSDIEKSRDELTSFITEIIKQMEELFITQFELLNSYFNESFIEIFGGGEAELKLNDPANVLTSGIEIRVKLPGKNLKVISLLSGGEKAFVAIALYFAILKARPTPFCVLDEIEAALDDANVYRFAGYLRKLCETTQFIVITHRRGTMENSDILYGVTMQEQGVSKLLIMNLGDFDEDEYK